MIVVSTLQLLIPTGHNRSQSKVLHLHTHCYIIMLSFWTRLLHSYPRPFQKKHVGTYKAKTTCDEGCARTDLVLS